MDRTCFTLLAALAIAACGGQTFTIASDGGAGSSSGGSSGGQDATVDSSGPACVSLPSDVGDQQQFCADEQHIFSACGNCEACRQADVNDCKKLGESLSDAMKSAIHACRDSQGICGDYNTYAGAPCVHHELLTATLSSAQAQAKTAYCNACPANASECAHFFDVGGDAGATSTAGIGAIVLLSNDSIVNDIVAGCSGAANCAPLAYQFCAGGKFCAQAPADNCKTGFCLK